MDQPTDAQLVFGAISAWAHDPDDPQGFERLVQIENDPEALVLAVGMAAWLAKHNPGGHDVMAEMASCLLVEG